MHLQWHSYRYYPYEKELALREVSGLVEYSALKHTKSGITVPKGASDELVDRLTYFASVNSGKTAEKTLQSQLENAASRGPSRQSTRYSVHGLHEYKGKFNPQVVRSILNIFNVRPHHRVLDPFCGSGTTLIECSHMRTTSLGIDLNPFAVFITNAKVLALSTPAQRLYSALRVIEKSLKRSPQKVEIIKDSRLDYLRLWFDKDTLKSVEAIRIIIESTAGDLAPVFLAIASNLLRQYSLQDPQDLRIRRRKTPLPERSFIAAFSHSSHQSIMRIESAQALLGTELPQGQATLCDVTTLNLPEPFDAAITSPPYAMALPYIDTQRLSLIWLGLVEPERIAVLEAELAGSRELRGQRRGALLDALLDNTYNLPESQAAYCRMLQENIAPQDGFRRQAVPMLLYRYFSSMLRSFRAIRRNLRSNAPFGLVVGRNHTVLGGVRYDIDTPAHLADLAHSSGWKISEVLPLQTYRRYGYHMNNAITAESLIFLQNP